MGDRIGIMASTTWNCCRIAVETERIDRRYKQGWKEELPAAKRMDETL